MSTWGLPVDSDTIVERRSDETSAAMSALRRMQADLRRLEDRVEAMGSSSTPNEDVSQELVQSLDLGLTTLRQAVADRFTASEEELDTLEKDGAALRECCEAAEKQVSSRDELQSATHEGRQSRLDTYESAPRASQLASTSKAPRLGGPPAEDDEARGALHSLERPSSRRSISPVRDTRYRSRSPGPRLTSREPGRRLEHSLRKFPDLAHPLPSEWEHRLLNYTFYFSLVEILRQKVVSKEMDAGVLHNELRNKLGSDYYNAILDVVGGTQRFLGLAARFVQISRVHLKNTVVLHSVNSPFYDDRHNEEFFARRSRA